MVWGYSPCVDLMVEQGTNTARVRGSIPCVSQLEEQGTYSGLDSLFPVELKHDAKLMFFQWNGAVQSESGELSAINSTQLSLSENFQLKAF